MTTAEVADSIATPSLAHQHAHPPRPPGPGAGFLFPAARTRHRRRQGPPGLQFHRRDRARARFPTDADVQKAYAITVGDALKLLREALLAKGLPDLSLLAGNKAYVPKSADLQAIRAGDFAAQPADFYQLLPPADQALLDAPAPVAEPPKLVIKKPTRPEALGLLARYAKDHPESVANMPKPHIALRRDTVLKLLMDGRNPAEAFLEGFGPPMPPPPPVKGKHH